MKDRTPVFVRSRQEKLVDAAARHLRQGSPATGASLPEDLLVQTAGRRRNFELRVCLADLYRGGHFGGHDVIKGYAWTLAAWHCVGTDYDQQFKLAETQQYYEFFLTAEEQAKALQVLDKVLPSKESRDYVQGNPFNAKWWGWEDDPIPARPGARDFKEQFVQWLMDGGYSESEIAEILSRCPPSDGPTRDEIIERAADDFLRTSGLRVAGGGDKSKSKSRG